MLRLLGILALGNMILGGHRCRRQTWNRHGSFLGGLFILPVLMFGGWIAIAVVAGILSLAATVIGGIFSGLSALASTAFSGNGLVLGIVIGLVLYFCFRRQKTETTEEE